MITLIKPILFAFFKSDAVKKLIIDLLTKLAESTDNDIDDKAVEFIKSSLALCTAQGGGTLKLSNKRSINCDIENNSGNINSMNSVFINHFLDLGWENPYGDTAPVVYTGRNSSQDRDGRMRFDETECSSGSQKKQIALWVKTHVDDDYKPKLIAKSGWCF